MSKTSYTSTFFGVDRADVDAAMLRGRQERSKAIWAMLQGIFGRPAGHQSEAKASSSQAVAPAHC